ncbi:MAG TPA: DNA repair protein [Pseudolabrys sp.]|nr:DNA repair protein [Pseudolabrys sp.]
MRDALRQQLIYLQKPASLAEELAALPLGVSAVDNALGGGLLCGAMHEITAASEAHLPAATGFTLGLAALANGNKHLVWIAEDMALTESGVPYSAGYEAFGLPPERFIIVAVAHRHELMTAMEEALRCRAVGAVLGEVRNGSLDAVAVRRLSLAASDSGTLAFLLRAKPSHDASTAATRWTVQTAPSVIPGQREFGGPRFAVHLTRNRRGPSASWILEWRNPDDRFVLATHAEPLAAPLRHRPYQKVA